MRLWIGFEDGKPLLNSKFSETEPFSASHQARQQVPEDRYEDKETMRSLSPIGRVLRHVVEVTIMATKRKNVKIRIQTMTGGYTKTRLDKTVPQYDRIWNYS